MTEESQEEQVSSASVPEVTDADRRMAGHLAEQLMSQCKTFQQVLGVLIAARQLYVVGRRDMEYRLAQLPAKQREMITKAACDLIDAESPDKEPPLPNPEVAWSMVEQVLVGAEANAAAKVFTEEALLAGLKQLIVPWLEKSLPEHSQWSKQDTRKAVEAHEEIRRNNPLPVGLSWSKDGDVWPLPRSKNLVLYGWYKAVRWVADQMVKNVLEAEDTQLFTVIRLATTPPSPKSPSRLLRYAPNMWKDCCRSSMSWPALFTRYMLRQLHNPPDLLVCDDLAHAAVSVGLLGGSAPRKAGEAHKRFKQWCDKVGAGFIGLVVMPDKDIDFQPTPEWDQLRNYSTLVAVRVEDEDDEYYRIYLGDNGTPIIVPKEDIDQYNTVTKLIVPT